MKIYKMQFTSDAYDWLTASEKIPLPVKQSFDGRPKKDSWTPLRVKKMGNKSTSGKALPLGDVPYFDSLPLFVCNKKVLDILSPLLAGNAEILPLIYDKEAYWAVNVTTTLDCVDYDQSRYVSFSSGRIMYFERYSFIKERITRDIFRITDEALISLFVSEKFVQTVTEHSMDGFVFTQVWEE